MRIAIIIPRYSAAISGGAEKLARELALEVVRQNCEAEIWTTCAEDTATWENVTPPGVSVESGVVVRRFPITFNEPEQRAPLDIFLYNEKYLARDEQYRWFEYGPHSVPMYEHVRQYAASFDAIVALPYLSPLIHYAAWSAPKGVILWPCLHDEVYAYLEPVRLLMETVRGVIYSSPEEYQLARHKLRIIPKHSAVLGAGVTSEKPGNEPALAFPYILYVGRLEKGKNLDTLYEYAARYYEENNDIRLALVGQGPYQPPDHPAFEHLGFVTEAEKSFLCQQAICACQPSLNESFSLIIMESWLAGRPVLVAQDCAVTYGHVSRSRGGLWFRSYGDYSEAIQWFVNQPSLAARMGQNGRHYVQNNYNWPAIFGNFVKTVNQWEIGGKNGPRLAL